MPMQTPVNNNVVVLQPSTDTPAALQKAGYTRFYNHILEALCQAQLSGLQLRVFMAVLRKTTGYNKPVDWVSAEQVCQMLNYTSNYRNICTIIRQLQARCILVKDGGKIGPNSDVAQWHMTPTTATAVLENTHPGMEKHTPQVLASPHPECGVSNTTKDISKNNKNITTPPSICPTFLQLFQHYPQHRRGPSLSAAWQLWCEQAYGPQDAVAALTWLEKKIQQDPAWSPQSNGRYVYGIKRFIREKVWTSTTHKKTKEVTVQDWAHDLEWPEC